MNLPCRRTAARLLLIGPAILTLPRAALATCDHRVTPAETEGPYYKAGAPERQMLTGREGGARLLLAGRVLGPDCRPVPGALLDFWQADEAGRYDNRGWALRGRQRADGRAAIGSKPWCPASIPAAPCICM